MGKREKSVTQINALVQELKNSKKESAAALAQEQVKGNDNLPANLLQLVIKSWGLWILLIALLLIVVTAGSTWLFIGSTFKKDSISFVEKVQELSTLATAEAHVEVIIEEEDNKLFGKDISVNLPGTKRELLIVVPATVIAGVDLKGITSDDMKINEEKKELEIVLPRAKLIQDPAIQMDKVRTFSDEGLFRGEPKWDKGFDLAAEAQEKIKEDAIEVGLLQTAEKSAEKVLKEFFGNLDYSVKVTFK
jgi:hypothetical protein